MEFAILLTAAFLAGAIVVHAIMLKVHRTAIATIERQKARELQDLRDRLAEWSRSKIEWETSAKFWKARTELAEKSIKLSGGI